MFVIEVVPLQRGVQIESLSYFSSTTYDIGTFLKIPVRGKQISAVVMECKPVSTTKTALKAATFSLRKLPQQTAFGRVPASLLKTVEELTNVVPAKSGAILYSLLPPDIRDGSIPYPQVKEHIGTEDPTPQILQAPSHERYVQYRSHIRSSFAHRGSVMFVVPTSADVVVAKEALKSGIEDRMISFSPAQTKKKRVDAYKAFDDLSASKLIICTPSHAYLEREDLTSIIVEQSASSYYLPRFRPYLDHRTILTTYARITNRSLLFGDIVARSEDEHRRRTDEYHTFGEPPKRFAIDAKLTIVKQNDKPTIETPFTLFSKELVKTMSTTLESRSNIFLLAARRGLAPVVACFDCGHIFRCPDSGTPYSLMRTYENGEEQRWFLSSTSGKRVPAADVCEQCGSWRLRERGIGIQQVFDECKRHFPDTPILLFDHSTAKTYKRATDLTKSFYSHKGAIMIGTTMAFNYLKKPVALSAIVSLDATRSIPTWKADEQLFHTLLDLRDRTEKEVVVQTRSETDDLLVYATRGAIERFFDDEIKLREMVGYPPFTEFVLLTWTGSPEAIKTTEALVKSTIPTGKARFYQSPLSQPKKIIRHCLIRIEKDQWPHPGLIEALRSLPPQIKIEVNPERIV
ncbi:MAG: hypothetical protein AAGA35_04395 [Patescibacteria group bacterium]